MGMGIKPNNGTFFVKDSNGNWVPVCQVTDVHFEPFISDSDFKKYLDYFSFKSPVTFTWEITDLSEEAAAQWWAIAQGGIEIVER